MDNRKNITEYLDHNEKSDDTSDLEVTVKLTFAMSVGVKKCS